MGQIAAANAVQDRQHRALRHAAKRKRLRPGGDEEVAATRRRQPPAHFNSAKAIAVGLYRGPATSLPALGRQPAPVRNQRIAIKQQAGGDIGYDSHPVSGYWGTTPAGEWPYDRKGVGWGQRVSVGGDRGGCGVSKKKRLAQHRRSNRIENRS